MKMHRSDKFLALVAALTLLPLGVATAEDMKNFSSAILKAEKSGGILFNDRMHGAKILGWRFLDKSNQSVGRIADIAVAAPSGDFEAVSVDPGNLGFIKMLRFDVKADNIGVEDQVMFTDLDKGQIFSHPEMFFPAGDPEGTVRLTALLDAPVLMEGTDAIGKVTDTLSPLKTMKLDALVVYLMGDRKSVPIPFSQVRVGDRGGKLKIVVTPDQYKIMQKFAR